MPDDDSTIPDEAEYTDNLELGDAEYLALMNENTRLRAQVEAVRALLDNPGDACDAFSGTYIDIEVVRAALGEEDDASSL